MFLLLHESDSNDPVLINTTHITTIGKGDFKRSNCSWIRFHNQKAQAVTESIETIVEAMNACLAPSETNIIRFSDEA